MWLEIVIDISSIVLAIFMFVLAMDANAPRWTRAIRFALGMLLIGFVTSCAPALRPATPDEQARVSALVQVRGPNVLGWAMEEATP